MLRDQLMTKVISMVKTLNLKSAPVTAEVINSVAKGFIITSDWSLLIEKRGYISLSHQWSRNVLYTMEQEGKKMCRRKATTKKILVNPGLLKEAKLHFQWQIKQMQEWHQIPDYLIINIDQIPLSYECSPRHTLHFKGVKSVPLVGKGKSKQITGAFLSLEYSHQCN